MAEPAAALSSGSRAAAILLLVLAEEEAAGRLERSLQHRRGNDAMEEFLRLASGADTAPAIAREARQS